MLSKFVLAGVAAALLVTSARSQCGGSERWAVKDGTDPSANTVDLTHIIPISIPDLLSITEPNLPNRGDDETRVVPQETHVYKVQARLVKWKEEAGESGDSDYHLVLTDDSLNYTPPRGNPTGHSFIGEIPDPTCLPGRNGNFGNQSPFLQANATAPLSIRTARSEIEARFPNAAKDGNWNDGGGIPVEVVGVGYFDPPHGQVGRSPHNLELHPILSIVFAEQQTEFAALRPGVAPLAAISEVPSNVIRPSTSTATTSAAAAAPQNIAVMRWQFTMITADSADKLLTNANALGAAGWEMVSVAVDTNLADRYVAYLKRPFR